MKLYTLKLVTIISDDALTENLTDDIKKLGAKGYTLEVAKGEGSHNTRTSELEGENIKLETIVSETVADKIMILLAEKYFEQYGLIAYVQNIDVYRGEKFI